jgi:hypothetical protein
MVGC